MARPPRSACWWSQSRKLRRWQIGSAESVKVEEGWKWFHASVDSAIFASAWVTSYKWKVCHRTWIIIRLLGAKCALYWLRSTPVTCSIFCSIFEALPLTSRRKENTGLLRATPFRSFTHYLVRRSTLLTHKKENLFDPRFLQHHRSDTRCLNVGVYSSFEWKTLSAWWTWLCCLVKYAP